MWKVHGFMLRMPSDKRTRYMVVVVVVVVVV
jgi:hypothetical protein